MVFSIIWCLYDLKSHLKLSHFSLGKACSKIETHNIQFLLSYNQPSFSLYISTIALSKCQYHKVTSKIFFLSPPCSNFYMPPKSKCERHPPVLCFLQSNDSSSFPQTPLHHTQAVEGIQGVTVTIRVMKTKEHVFLLSGHAELLIILE